jgi:hypothetical protein
VNVFNLLIYIINVFIAIYLSAIQNIINIPNINSQIYCDNVNKHKLFIIIRRIMVSRATCSGMPTSQK